MDWDKFLESLMDEFVENRESDYLDFLYNRFDSPEIRKMYCQARESALTEFAINRDDDLKNEDPRGGDGEDD